MEKHQSIKRLGYGFSALVMALSATAFVPSFSNTANAASECVEVAQSYEGISTYAATDCEISLSKDVEMSGTVTVTGNLTIDLNGHNITTTYADGPIFKVTSGTLTIKGDGTITQNQSGRVIVNGGATIEGGTYVTDYNVFANGSIATVKGGDFTKAAGLGGNVTVSGGVFATSTTGATLADGYAAYVLDEEAGTYYVTTKLNVYPAVTSDTVSVNKARNIATYSIVKDYEGEEMKPEIAVTLDGAEATEEDYELSYGVYNTERNVVAATLNKVGRYVFTIKDAAGVDKRVTLDAYEVAEENINENVYSLAVGGEAKDVTADLGVDPISAIKEVTSDKDTVATVAIVDDKLTVAPVNAGTANITVTMKGNSKTAEKLTFTVNVYRTNASSYLVKAGAEVTSTLNTSPWAINPELPEDGVLAAATVTAPATLNGRSSITLKGAKAGNTTLTLKSDEEGTVTKDVKVSVYEIAEEVAMAKGTTLSALSEEIIKLPEGFTVESIVETDVAETSVALNGAGEDQIFTAVSAGSKTYKYTVTKGTLTDSTNVTVYVYGEESKIEAQTVALKDELDIADFYTPASASSTVTYAVEGDGATITEDGVFSSTKVGEKTVTITETLAGKTIAEQTAIVTVTGVETPDVEFFAGETGTWTVTAEGVKIDTENITTNTNLAVKNVDGGFEFSADKAGVYPVTYGIEGSTTTVTQMVTVYNKVATADEDLTIDLVEGSTDTDASFKVTGDGTITVEAEDGLKADTNPAGEGTYKFTAEKVGEYEVKISQKVGDSLTAEKTLTVKVTDSTKTEDTDPTEPDKPGEDNPGEDKPGEEKPVETVALKSIAAKLGKDAIYPGESTAIFIEANEGVDAKELSYGFTSDNGYAWVDFENGEVKAYANNYVRDDQKVTFTITAEDKDGNKASTKVSVTVKKNYVESEEDYKVVEGDKQTFVMGSGKGLTFKIDGPYDEVKEIIITNKTLEKKLEEAEWNWDILTDKEKASYWFGNYDGYGNLVAGEDYTIKQGSTVLTLTDTFMAKLVAGEYELAVYYLDASEAVRVGTEAKATFTVTDVATPDTGVATSEGKSATANIAMAFVSAVSAIALAGAATIRKMFRK